MADTTPVRFETTVENYKHWTLSIDGAIATLAMNIDEDGGLREGYKLKLNSYDLGVDIELRDAVERLRFEHPEVKSVVVTSGNDRVFCAGANIKMLGLSDHPFKVNFCKFTNETRIGMEDASENGGLKFMTAANGTCAGGGYELALATDEIVLIDDSNSAVSLPEVPLLAVLPGTGGLTRLVDKRKVRRDIADFFCTTIEGVKGKRAVDYKLVDAVIPKSKWAEGIRARAEALAEKSDRPGGPGVALTPITPERDGDVSTYKYVTLRVDTARRVAELEVRAPDADAPADAAGIFAAGAELWSLRAYRELDDAILDLRHNHPTVGLVTVSTRGDKDRVLAADAALHAAATGDDAHWFAREVFHHQKRVLKRVDVTSRSFVALVDNESCFAGSLAELLWSADRSYMLDDVEAESGARIVLGVMNKGAMPMGSGLSRLESHFYGDAPALEAALAAGDAGPIDAAAAEKLGIVTFVADDIDYPDETRLFIEERASLSPDALTGMEASLRFPGPETMETRIFARLSAWQNWIFIRENATGPSGALTNYGQPVRPEFDFRRC